MVGYDFKKSHFDKLQDYIQAGSSLELTEEEQCYLDVLYLLNSLRRKYGKENAIAFVQRPPYGLSYRRSRLMYDEAINLFYLDDGIEKQAHRNMLFEQLLSAAAIIMKTAETPKDLEIYGDLISRAHKIKGLDVPEAPKVPEALYAKPIKIYSLSPKAIGLTNADRNALAERIDALEVPEVEKRRFRQESGVEDVNFLEMLDDQESKIGSEQG
jgi:hypothetical protein